MGNDNYHEYAFSFLRPDGRRPDHGSNLEPLSVQLDQHGRDKAQVLSRDLYTDSNIFTWAINFHTTHTTCFAFQPYSTDDGFNRALNDYYDYVNQTLDITGRYTFEELREVWEIRRVLDGDILLVKTQSGEVQTIQSDWIRSDDKDGWVQGIQLNEYGRALAYAVERDTTRGRVVRAEIPATHAIFSAYYDPRIDSYRGVSPYISSFADFDDIEILSGFMMAKIKIEAILGIGIKKQHSSTPFNFNNQSFTGETGDSDTDAPAPRRKWNLTGGGVKLLDLLPGEDITQFGQTSPSSSYQQYLLSSVQKALKPLDIPMTLYQENLSNYYCSRAAYGLYRFANRRKTNYNQRLYTSLFRWRMAVDVLNGTFSIPSGMLIRDVPIKFILEDHSVLDMDKEMRGWGLAVQNGFSSPQEACAARGKDFYKVIDETAKAVQYATEKGVSLGCINMNTGGIQ